jgi:hypothetical protein
MGFPRPRPKQLDFVVGRTGLEPVTPCASCKCATNCANGPSPATLALGKSRVTPPRGLGQVRFYGAKGATPEHSARLSGATGHMKSRSSTLVRPHLIANPDTLRPVTVPADLAS